MPLPFFSFFFFQAEDGIRDGRVTGVQRVLFRSLKLAAISPAGLLRARIFHSYKLLLNLLERDFPLIQKVTFLTSISQIGGFRDTVFSSKTRSEERRVGKECRYRWAP